MGFEMIGPLTGIETIARGRQIRELDRLVEAYGAGRWVKRKGMRRVRFEDGETTMAEVHWHEAHGIGRHEFKIKRIIGNWL